MDKKIYVTLIVAVFVAFTVVFDTLPRSTYSELEKRELKKFPPFTADSLKNGSFTAEVSSWFSDSEPYRDVFMALSMKVKGLMALTLPGEETVRFHASDAPAAAADTIAEPAGGEMGEYVNNVTADENAKIANAGIIVVGEGKKVRALMAFGGGAKGGGSYARLANAYGRALGSGVTVYCMAIPIASEFYCPDKARSATRPQLPVIRNIYAQLDEGVKPVDAYSALAAHAGEDIYLRTDHHWAPLGAYYAAQAFARTAGVPFRDLSHYDRHVVRRFVGSMYGYSKDISVKEAPEDFVYYTPRGINYTTTYQNYTIDEHYRVTGVSKPARGPFFYHYRDGNGGAYSTFMGSDAKLTVVKTGTANGRRVLIIKDSFGNALPGYLFFSFEEVHVVDFRYFKKNVKAYVRDNHITDVLFACNIFNAYSGAMNRNCMRFLTQDGTITPPPPLPGGPHAADSLKRPASPTAPADSLPKHPASARRPDSSAVARQAVPKA